MEIRAGTVLPARRTPITLHTADGLRLVGELALPAHRDPVATLIWVHPLPTHGGMMDSHVIRKASNRLPALADLAVLRFNTRGTSSEQGTSEGEFGEGVTEQHDMAAAIGYAVAARLPRLWLLGWSFGTELVLEYGNDPAVEGAILLSPPLHRASEAALDAWAASGRPLIAVVPEFDDYLRPDEARRRFTRVPQAEIIAVDRAKHLWVGEPYVRIVLNEIVRRINPAAWPLPTEWKDPMSVSPFDLTGKNAFVTGASRGIGRAVAVALAAAGADLALVARSEDGLAATAQEVAAHGRKAFVIPADVTSEEAVRAAVAAAIERLGHLDIVVNNAGGSNFMVPFAELRLGGWDKIMTLNVNSTVFVCHAVAAHLIERGSGSVINMASVAGLLGSPLLSPYGAAKASVISLTKSLAIEWAANGVRVNALCPGWTATDLNRILWDDGSGGQATVASVPLRRWGRAEEMGGPAVFLASDASSYMTGQTLVVDGGQTITP